MKRAGAMLVSIALLWSVVSVSMYAPAQPEANTRPADAETAASMEFAGRLTALSPKRPEAYFELAEEVSDSSNGIGTRRLAIRLFVLAYVLDRARPESGRLAASSCIALSALSGAPRDRVWLHAIAKVLDPQQSEPAWTIEQEPTTTDSTSFQLATLLGYVRSGDGQAAKKMLEKSAVREALERHNRRMTRMGAWSASAVEREAERWKCTECGNSRVVRRVNSGTVEFRVCPHCKGNPGPMLSTRELTAQLRFESWLLQGTQRSWAAQLGVDDGAPLIDADPGSVASNFDIDPRLVLWRNGRWVKAEDDKREPRASDPIKEPAPGAPEEPAPSSAQ